MHTGKKIFTPLIALLYSCSNPADKNQPAFFTGEVEYSYSFESSQLNKDSLKNARPFKGIFRYDSADYQSDFIGKNGSFSYYYSGIRNKCLSSFNGIMDSTCEDYSTVTDSILSWKLYPTDENIYGHNCNVLEMQKKNSRVQYYVSRDMKLSPASYKRHRSYNWDFYGEKAGGGLILKLEHRFAKFTMMGTVVSVIEKKKGYNALTIAANEFERLCNK